MPRLVAFVTVMVVIAAAGSSSAQNVALPSSSPPPPPAASDAHTRAEEAFARGIELIQRQAWSDALAAFQEAHRLYPTPSALFNIGYCQRALGEYVASLATLEAFLASDVTGPAASRRTQAEEFVRELRARVATLIVEIGEGQREGTDVMVDGRPVSLDARGESRSVVDPGHHTIAARREGSRPLFVDRDVQDGAQLRVSLQLVPLPAHVFVTANVSRAAVRMDGRRVGVSPFDADVAPGPLRIEVTAPGYVPHRAALNLLAGATARVTAQLTPEPVPIYRRWWFWSAVGVVVTGAIVTTYIVTRPAPSPPPYNCGSLDWCP